MKQLIAIMTALLASGFGTLANEQQEVVPTVIVEETQPETTIVEEDTTTPAYQHNHAGDCINVDCPLFEEHHDENGYPLHSNNENCIYGQSGQGHGYGQGHGNGYGHHGNRQ